MIKEVIQQTRKEMDKSLEALKNNLDAIRTGRASTSLVDKIQVDYYGTPTILQQLALTSVPEPQLISIRPYDPGAIKDIERAIMQSNIGITPSNDGKIIRLQIPPLTEERRRILAKDVNVKLEDARIGIRNHRRDSLDYLKELEKEKEISEDDFYQGRDEMQKVTDEYIKKAEEIGQAKEEEIMSF